MTRDRTAPHLPPDWEPPQEPRRGFSEGATIVFFGSMAGMLAGALVWPAIAVPVLLMFAVALIALWVTR